MTDITDLEKLMNKVRCVGTKIHDLCHSNVQQWECDDRHNRFRETHEQG